jgi:tetratricopeptide (TPR) repeat protein
MLLFLLLPLAASAQPSGESLAEELEGKSPRERFVHLKQMVDEGNVSKEIYFYLGNASYETGDVNGAIIAFSRAIELDPQYFKAIVNLALMYDEQQKFSLAIETFEKAAEIEPQNPDVWSHLGNAYYGQGEYPKAMEYYRKALDIDPDSGHALYSMGVAFADAGIFREAVRYWSRVSELEPDTELGRSAAENVDLLQRYLIPR